MLHYAAILVVLLCWYPAVDAQLGGQCRYLTPCACQYDDGTIIDLAPLARSDSLPRYANLSDATGDLFSWNPCLPFTYVANHSECFDVAVCLIRPGFPRELVYNLGAQSSATYSVEDGYLYIIYTAQNEGFTRMPNMLDPEESLVISISSVSILFAQGIPMSPLTVKEYGKSARIKLVCSELEAFLPTGEEGSSLIYDITLASPIACGNNGVLSPSKDNGGLSGGTIFVIIAASLIGAYIIFGMAYQKFIRKETGVKVFPNHDLWCETVPGLVKDGVTCKACNSGGEKKYDSI